MFTAGRVKGRHAHFSLLHEEHPASEGVERRGRDKSKRRTTDRWSVRLSNRTKFADGLRTGVMLSDGSWAVTTQVLNESLAAKQRALGGEVARAAELFAAGRITSPEAGRGKWSVS